MNYNEITELIKLISDSHLSEFKMKDGEFEIAVKTDKYQKKTKETTPIIHMSGGQPNNQPAADQGGGAVAQTVEQGGSDEGDTADAKSDESKLLKIKSPMVGTFYRSSSPDKPPFIKVGDQIEKGAVVCIVEAMKLFNEIESEISGKVVKVMIEDAAPVEYDQVLFLVDPN